MRKLYVLTAAVFLFLVSGYIVWERQSRNLMRVERIPHGVRASVPVKPPDNHPTERIDGVVWYPQSKGN